MQCLFFESMNNPIFFKSLPQQEPWYKLYNLLRDSTFYFQNEKGKYINILFLLVIPIGFLV